MNIEFKKKSLKNKRVIILIGSIVLIIGLSLFWIYILAETSSDCIGTNISTQHCCTCLSIDASPTSINQGGSSTLTLSVDNNPNGASLDCSSPNGFSSSDGTAVCSIDNGVRSNATFNDGSYDYSVSPSNTTTYIATCSGIGGTKSTSITITVMSNQSPIATNLSVDTSNYCTYSLPTIFSWTYSDPELDAQKYYQVQIDNNSDFSSINFDSGKILSLSGAYTGSEFGYNTTYYWQLKVWDDRGADSGWIPGPSFSTPVHKYPNPDFTSAPSSPSIDEIVQLCAVQNGPCGTNVSTCYNSSNDPISCSGNTFLWTLPTEAEFASTSNASTENPQIKFTDSGNYMVTLKITDSTGSCSVTKPIQATLPLPEWIEITP